jgi:acetoacetate decarboxylase
VYWCCSKNNSPCDGKPRILELVRFDYKDLLLKGAWTGPGALELFYHVLAPLAEFPVRETVSVTHTICDVTLPFGKLVYDYLAWLSKPN